MCSRFYQWYLWSTNTVQGSTNDTIGNTIGNVNATLALPMVPLLPMVSQWYHWYHRLPMVPLVKLPMIPLGEPRTVPILTHVVIDFWRSSKVFGGFYLWDYKIDWLSSTNIVRDAYGRPVRHAKCQMLNANWQMPIARCEMIIAKCLMRVSGDQIHYQAKSR